MLLCFYDIIDANDDARIEIKNSIEAKLSTCEKLEETASDDRKKRQRSSRNNYSQPWTFIFNSIYRTMWIRQLYVSTDGLYYGNSSTECTLCSVTYLMKYSSDANIVARVTSSLVSFWCLNCVFPGLLHTYEELITVSCTSRISDTSLGAYAQQSWDRLSFLRTIRRLSKFTVNSKKIKKTFRIFSRIIAIMRNER